MQNLIDDLLQLSRISTRARDFELVNLNDVILQVKDMLELKIKEKNAKILHPNLPIVKADPVQLFQLFQNLISNSIKYNQNQPLINIDVKADKSKWLFSIKDNGIGFDEKFKERIFVAFQRLHRREEYDGSGIGLAVCKKIVNRHGGTISVNSKPGEGSTFHFSLPKNNTSK